MSIRRCPVLLIIFAALVWPVMADAAATFTPILYANVPLSDTVSPFDVSNTGNIYGIGSGTNFETNPANNNYDIRDLFGGTFNTVAPERGNVLFADSQPLGTVESAIVILPSAVAIKSFDLYLGEDQPDSANRSAREFKLFAGTTLVDDVTILNNFGSQSYFGQYGGDYLDINDTLASPVSATNYTLDFYQNEAAGTSSGLRVLEFDAAVPEPAGLTILAVATIGLMRRHNKPRQ